MLQHGSILIEDDQPLVSELASVPVPDPQPAATLAGALGRVPSFDEVAVALFEAVRSLECDHAAEMDMNPTVRDASRALGRYLDDGWTWRR